MTWIIEDWTSKHVYKDKTFTSFDDARDFINDVANTEATDKDGNVNEDLYDGICEDLYAVEVKE